MLATLDNLSTFKNASSIKTWVYRIAINKSIDFLRYKGRKKRSAVIISISKNEETDAMDFVPTNFIHPGIQLENKEQHDALFGAINQLPEKQKQAIIMAKLDQMQMKEIALIMNTTPKAVESLLSRARKNLKIQLEKLEFKIK